MERITDLEQYADPEAYYAKKAGVATGDKPSNPQNGDMWFNKTTGDSYVYYADFNDSQWIRVGGSAK